MPRYCFRKHFAKHVKTKSVWGRIWNIQSSLYKYIEYMNIRAEINVEDHIKYNIYMKNRRDELNRFSHIRLFSYLRASSCTYAK